MNGNELTKGLYMNESENALRDNHSASVTLRMSVSSAAMLNAIAARFETSRYKLTEDALNKFAKDAFAALDEDDRKSIALIADKEITELMLKKGAKIKSSGMSGDFEDEWSIWREEVLILEHYYVDEDGNCSKKNGDK